MRIFLATLFLMLMALVVPGNTPAQTQPITIDAATRAAVIDSLCTEMTKYYIFLDKAEEVDRTLHANLKAGDYDDLNDLAALLDAVSEDMHEITQDKHLGIRVLSEEEVDRIKRQLAGEEPEEISEEEQVAAAASDNFGFEKVERLQGNIGYLKFDGFQNASHAAPTAVAAIQFLSNSDALIIDLRENGGGSPTMIQLITSYFFDEPVHLNSFYIRHTDETKQFWTQAQVDGKRMSDVPIFILTSGNTFSAAEEFSYNLKHLERATLIGETTGGGAHPVDIHVFPDLRVGMALPFGRAINPVTGTNWEGVGVVPHIDVPASEALDVAVVEALKSVMETAEGPKRDRLEFTVKRLEALREPAQVPMSTLSAWAGTYGPRKITLEDGILWYQREGNPRHRMIPVSETLFCFEDIDYFMLQVETNADGEPAALVGHYRGTRTDRSPRDGA